MQLLVGGHPSFVIAATVEADVDGVSERSHPWLSSCDRGRRYFRPTPPFLLIASSLIAVHYRSKSSRTGPSGSRTPTRSSVSAPSSSITCVQSAHSRSMTYTVVGGKAGSIGSTETTTRRP